MTKTTYEREIEDPVFKKEYDEHYQKFMAEELKDVMSGLCRVAHKMKKEREADNFKRQQKEMKRISKRLSKEMKDA